MAVMAATGFGRNCGGGQGLAKNAVVGYLDLCNQVCHFSSYVSMIFHYLRTENLMSRGPLFLVLLYCTFDMLRFMI